MLSPTVSIQQAEPPLALTLDVGTSSVRALLFDRLGRAVEGVFASGATTLRAPEPGAVEIQPGELLETCLTGLDAALDQASRLARQIAAVGVSTLASNVLGVDEDGQAITPIYTYADSRPAPDVAALRAQFDEAEIHRRTGCRFHPSYLPARFLWLKRTRPELLQRAKRWMSFGEYLLLRLFGRTAVSASIASWSGLLERQRLTWDEALLAGLPLRAEQLSPLAQEGQAFTGLSGAFAARWPALLQASWHPAVADGAAANVGAGCTSPERLALTIGTTSALRLMMAEPAGSPDPARLVRRAKEVGADPLHDVPWGLWCYRADRRRSLLGGALTEGGNLFDWMTRSLNLADAPDMERALAEIPPDSHGLTILPFLAGERSPGWAGDARGAIHGLTLNTEPLHIVRAGLEAVALRLSLVYSLLGEAGSRVQQVIAGGGAARRSPVWLQIIADAIGRPVVASPVGEPSGRGAALMALEAAGEISDLDAAPDFPGTAYAPDEQNHRLYRQALERQGRLYTALVGTREGAWP